MDNKNTKGMQDRIKVDANDRSEVEYLHQQYPHLTHEQVLDAVKREGPYREDIKAYLDTLKK
ncbi:MAG: DUF3606 domain-containing protein [Bacteroidota bacterium]